MKTMYTPDAEEFYKQFKSYKIVCHLAGPSIVRLKSIEVNDSELMCKLKPSIQQEAYYKYVTRARLKNILFNMTFDQYINILKQKCTYCGSKSESVDRIVPIKGYVTENIQPICKVCNTMKFTFTENDFLEHINKIHRFTSHTH